MRREIRNAKLDRQYKIEAVIHVPADVSAGQFWLMNRRPDRWRVPGEINPPPSEENNILRQMAEAWNYTGKRPKES